MREYMRSAGFRNILQHPMTVENFDNMLNFMSGTSLYKLSKHHKRV